MNSLKLILLMSFFTFFSKAQTLEPITSIYDITINTINGQVLDLNDYKNKKILFVNVASKCGFTKQYEGLQQLYTTYKDRLMIIGVPCNQFGEQEPGKASEIESFCKLNYGVNFVITEKIDVKGDKQHSLYEWLTKKKKNGKMNSSVKWNFQKYLIDEKGKLIDVFYSITKPMSSKIVNSL